MFISAVAEIRFDPSGLQASPGLQIPAQKSGERHQRSGRSTEKLSPLHANTPRSKVIPKPGPAGNEK
jgi:hypothetical protein